MTSYETLYNKALSKITDPTLGDLPEEDLESMLYGWLIGAVAKMRKCTHELSNRNEELKCFNDDLTDTEQEIIAILMVREWLAPQLYSVTEVAQYFGGREQKWFSQSQHMTELRAMDDSLKHEAQQLSRDFTYIDNDYFD